MDLAEVRSFLREKETRRKAALGKRWNEAREDFSRIIALIIAKYNPPWISSGWRLWIPKPRLSYAGQER